MSMDTILKASEQDFVSLPVFFKEFYRCAKEGQICLKRAKPDDVTVHEMLKDDGLSSIAASHLLNAIDVSDLRTKMPNHEMDNTVERNNLLSQKILQAENSRRRNAQYKSIALRALRYDHIERDMLARHTPYKEDRPETVVKKEKHDADDYHDLVISTSVFFGYSRELEYHEIRLGRLLKVTDRIEMLGNHTLQDLKNAFHCPADYTFSEDFSEKKPTAADLSKNQFPSAMFFIHDTFYIEPNSKPNWEDPSSVIRKWSEKRPMIGPFNVKCMNEQKLGDLTARLGQPYVFIHQGFCEHLLIFNDLSLKDEEKDVTYPRKLVERNFRRIACIGCKEQSADWVIHKHEDLFPTSPAFMCEPCYKEFCFDKDGKKVCDFIAAPYCDRKKVGELAEDRFYNF